MDWLHPQYLIALAATPFVVALYLWSALRRRRAVRSMGDRAVIERLTPGLSRRRRRWKAAAVTLAVLLLGLALAGPRFGKELREVRREGVDLIVALDVSLSMQARDVSPSRLDRAVNELKKLLDDLRGDRVGLVLFAGDAFIQCPLTTDYGAVRLFLDVASPRLIPTPGTDFGAALAMAERAFRHRGGGTEEERTRVVLIVSDGENHVGDLTELSERARREGILVYAAGVGETEGVPIPVGTTQGNPLYKKDRRGQVVMTRLNEDPLRLLSQEGAYFRIARTSSSLPRIISALERLDRTEYAREEFEEYEEKYQWPLALACFLLLGERLVRDRRRTRFHAR